MHQEHKLSNMTHLLMVEPPHWRTTCGLLALKQTHDDPRTTVGHPEGSVWRIAMEENAKAPPFDKR